MIKNLTSLAHPSIQDLTPYQPGKPISELERELGITNVIKLASNENPLGPSPKGIAAANAQLPQTALYPDGSGYILKHALSQHLGVDQNTLTLVNGSDALFALLGQAFVSPGQDVIVSQYGFAAYAIAARIMQANLITTPAKNWGHDLAAMANAITANTRLIFIANPNNPTGSWIDEDALKGFLHHVPADVLVVLDEAYCEYVEEKTYPQSLQLLPDYPNLILARTFSKIYGLAGLRLGYGVAHPQITDILNRVRLPFNINSLALVAGAAALTDAEHILRSRENNKAGMAQLIAGFNQLNLPYLPSIGNFLTIDVKRDANTVYQALLREGVIVRPLAPYQMPTHLRITIGRPEQNERLLKSLKKVLSSE